MKTPLQETLQVTWDRKQTCWCWWDSLGLLKSVLRFLLASAHFSFVASVASTICADGFRFGDIVCGCFSLIFFEGCILARQLFSMIHDNRWLSRDLRLCIFWYDGAGSDELLRLLLRPKLCGECGVISFGSRIALRGVPTCKLLLEKTSLLAWSNLPQHFSWNGLKIVETRIHNGKLRTSIQDQNCHSNLIQ